MKPATLVSRRAAVVATLCGLAAALTSIAVGTAQAAPILQQISPNPTSYRFGVFGDFTQYPGTALGDVTGKLQAVNLQLPPLPVVISVSGCQAADFSGFVAGSIALMERGSCTFGQKAANAAAAGAIAALIFNDGPAVNIAFSVAAGIPTLFTSFAVGSDLASLLKSGDVEMRIDVTSLDDGVAPILGAVSEPGAIALFGGGLALLGLRSRRSRTRR